MEILTPSDYESGNKRRARRSGRPCDACRKKKTRCVTKDGDPRCIHCQLRRSQCTFNHEPPDRPSNPSNQVEESSSSSLLSADINHQAPDIASPAQRPLSGSAHARLQSPIGPNSTPDASALGLAQSRFAELYGLGSDMEPILMRHRPYDPVTHEFSLETHAIRRVLERDGGLVEYPLTFHMVSDENAVDFEGEAARADAIEACIGPHGPRLVELFWRHVQPCYPLLHKDIFMDNYNASYRRVSAALLGAVYLSALRWWSYDPMLSIRALPDSSLLRHLLKQALASSYHRPKLSSIQAALLLLQCQPEDPLNPDHTYAWGLTCQVLAIGQCLGLHLDASSWSIPNWEKNLRKRLSWALYMQDRWTALAYGRPVHIHHDDWTVRELENLDFADCDSSTSDDDRRSISATGKTQFIHMVRLTQLLSSVLSSFYTARMCFDQDTVLLYQRSQELLRQLQLWYASIPASLQMDVSYERKLCFHGYLHFSFYGVMMALLRRLIRSTALPPRCADDAILSNIRQTALQTAQNAISFARNLRSDQLEAFWYFSAILRGLEHALAVNLIEPSDDTVSPMMANFSTEALEYTDFGDWDLAAGVDGAFDLLSGIQLDATSLMPGDPTYRG
ncbi:uncharacterized protein JN550_009722 [Neoarthrinium moseri]|uniref:uncharacterized protein n=1 Tax=Neoarthrinium moseri TaxID=1658444 RepID=UPI001FDCF010|nr:uncharacterized protein JN550_009722 [Neoarthrinium moseri]KAI1863196.1 hypothetical protein JN550_009722 [Neoarthrinium moseri]